MSVYVIAQLKFTKREAYNRYQERFMEVFRQFDGTLLVADEKPLVLEGKWEMDKIVIMSFPDEAASRRCFQSQEYLEIAKDRKAGAQAVVLMAAGRRSSSGNKPMETKVHSDDGP